MRVFISYSTKNGKNYASNLRAILKKRGHDAFLADHDIYGAENLWDVIAKECLERDLSIFIITPSSKESKGQKQEYDLVVYNYRNRMAFVNNNAHSALKRYPFLELEKRIDFDDSSFEKKCEELSSQLVSLQDKEKTVAEHEEEYEYLPTLYQEGLDASEISRCVKNLTESYQEETIIPDVCRTNVYEKKTSSTKFIGFVYRLPKEWFLPNQLYSNVVMFRNFGRRIALGEQSYLQKQILDNKEILCFEDNFSPDAILKAIKEIHDSGFKPNAILMPIEYLIKMYHWRGTAYACMRLSLGCCC